MIGAALALLVGGSPTVAFGLVIGAALGLISGAVVQRNNPRDATTSITPSWVWAEAPTELTWRGAMWNMPLAT